jgi:hypothetical protein
MGAGLVADPIPVGIPERTGVQAHHPPSGPGQPLSEDSPAGAAADHDRVHLVVGVVSSHVGAKPVVRARAIIWQ